MTSSDNTNPLVSIVTVSLNSERYMEESIRSVSDQSYPNIEHIIIDGGSSDGTLDIIERNKDCISDWVSEPDKGMYDAINKGIHRSRGEIVAYLNSDDLYLPGAIEQAVQIFRDNPDVDLVFGGLSVIDGAGTEIYRFRHPKFWWPIYVSIPFCTIGQPASFWRRSVHDKVGFFDSSIKLAGDFDFYARLIRHCKSKSVSTVLAAFRVHGDSLSQTLSAQNTLEVALIHSRYASGNIFFRLIRPLIGAVGKITFQVLNFPALWTKLRIGNASDKAGHS